MNSHSRPSPFFGLVQLVRREDREQLPSTSIQAMLAYEYPDDHAIAEVTRRLRNISGNISVRFSMMVDGR